MRELTNFDSLETIPGEIFDNYIEMNNQVPQIVSAMSLPIMLGMLRNGINYLERSKLTPSQTHHLALITNKVHKVYNLNCCYLPDLENPLVIYQDDVYASQEIITNRLAPLVNVEQLLALMPSFVALDPQECVNQDRDWWTKLFIDGTAIAYHKFANQFIQVRIYKDQSTSYTTFEFFSDVGLQNFWDRTYQLALQKVTEIFELGEELQVQLAIEAIENLLYQLRHNPEVKYILTIRRNILARRELSPAEINTLTVLYGELPGNLISERFTLVQKALATYVQPAGLKVAVMDDIIPES